MEAKVTYRTPDTTSDILFEGNEKNFLLFLRQIHRLEGCCVEKVEGVDKYLPFDLKSILSS